MLEINKLTGAMSASLSKKRSEFFSSDGLTDWFDWTNGAGKSTTINKLLVLLHPYAGEVRII